MALLCTLSRTDTSRVCLLHRLPNGDTLPLPGAGCATEADGAWWQEALAMCADWEQPPEDWPLPDRLLVGRVLARMAAWQGVQA